MNYSVKTINQCKNPDRLGLKCNFVRFDSHRIRKCFDCGNTQKLTHDGYIKQEGLKDEIERLSKESV